MEPRWRVGCHGQSLREQKGLNSHLSRISLQLVCRGLGYCTGCSEVPEGADSPRARASSVALGEATDSILGLRSTCPQSPK